MKVKIIPALILIFYSTTLLPKDYPFQKPHRFNPDWQQSLYQLAGDFAIYSKESDLFYQTSSPLIPSKNKNQPTEFVTNKKHSILESFFSKGLDDSKKCNNYKLPNPFNEGTTIIFTPNKSKFPTAVVTRKGDLIIIYIGQPQNPVNGSKLTFNIDNFENYMTTTEWYDSLDYRVGGKTKIDRRISFGFAFNADKANFNMLDNDALLPDTFTLNMLYISLLLSPTGCSPIPVYIKDITPLPATWKWKQKGIKNSYEDLLKTNNIDWKGQIYAIPPSITITPINNGDFNTFKELIKKGNTQ